MKELIQHLSTQKTAPPLGRALGNLQRTRCRPLPPASHFPAWHQCRLGARAGREKHLCRHPCGGTWRRQIFALPAAALLSRRQLQVDRRAAGRGAGRVSAGWRRCRGDLGSETFAVFRYFNPHREGIASSGGDLDALLTQGGSQSFKDFGGRIFPRRCYRACRRERSRKRGRPSCGAICWRGRPATRVRVSRASELARRRRHGPPATLSARPAHRDARRAWLAGSRRIAVADAFAFPEDPTGNSGRGDGWPQAGAKPDPRPHRIQFAHGFVLPPICRCDPMTCSRIPSRRRFVARRRQRQASRPA